MEISFDGFMLETFAEIDNTDKVSELYVGWIMLASAPGA